MFFKWIALALLIGALSNPVHAAPSADQPPGQVSANAEAAFRQGKKLSERAAFASSKSQQRVWAQEAERLLKVAAGSGHVGAQYELGHLFAGFMLGETDERVALEWYERAAEGNHAAAQFEAGLYYYNGRGTRIDLGKAAYWYDRAARNGDLQAANKLMLMLYFGDGIPKDQARSHGLMVQMADRGSVGAMTAAGQALEWGDGIPRDLSEAEKWYRRAADRGDWIAQFRLGLILEKRGDIDSAVGLYSKSSSKRRGAGEFRLAKLYEEGRGVSKDPVQARKFYEAAYNGLPEAVRYIPTEKLVLYYAKGIGGPANPKKVEELVAWVERGPAGYERCKAEWRTRGAPGGRCEWVFETDLL